MRIKERRSLAEWVFLATAGKKEKKLHVVCQKPKFDKQTKNDGNNKNKKRDVTHEEENHAAVSLYPAPSVPPYHPTNIKTFIHSMP